MRFGNDRKDPHYDVRVEKTPEWPPHWPYDTLMSCVWPKRIADAEADPAEVKLVEVNTKTGTVILMDSSGPQAAYSQKIWVDTRNGYTIPRLEGYDKKTGRLVQKRTCSYKLYQGKYWYPDHIVDTYYRYKEDGTRYVNSRGEVQAQAADLNVDIPEKELVFDDIPFGATVHDERFQPTLDYRQGDQQYTDEELFKARNDKSKLHDMQSTPAKPSALPMSSSMPIVVGGLSVFTIYIQDYDSVYPMNRFPDANHALSGCTSNGVQPDDDLEGTSINWKRVLSAYVKTNEIFGCPSNRHQWDEGDLNKSPGDETNGYYPMAEWLPNSYAINGSFFHEAVPPCWYGEAVVRPRYVLEIDAPASLIMLEESRYSYPDLGNWYLSRRGPDGGNEGPYQSHNGTCNWLFADWHAKRLKPQNTCQPQMWTDRYVDKYNGCDHLSQIAPEYQ